MHLTYDPSMTDVDPPVFGYITGPAGDAVVRDSAIVIEYAISDTNGIDTAYWTMQGAFAGPLTNVTRLWGSDQS